MEDLGKSRTHVTQKNSQMVAEEQRNVVEVTHLLNHKCVFYVQHGKENNLQWKKTASGTLAMQVLH